MQTVDSLIENQLSSWSTARENYVALNNVRIKDLKVGNVTYKIQFNPARIRSSAAKVDKASLKARKCFLCGENRPSEQEMIPFNGHYEILLNPFPIFPRHLTIPEKAHTPQRILGRFGDMLDLAEYLSDFTIFYNGPKCGASAPDHAHFQAGNKGFMPIEQEWKKDRKEMIEDDGAILWHIGIEPCPCLVIEASNKEKAEQMFTSYYDSLGQNEEEPMMNILAMKENSKWIVFLFPRKKHRPDCYYAEGENNLLISPASVDMGGVFIVPQEKDYNKIKASDIELILNEVCLSKEEVRQLENKIIEKYGRANN